eukprot:6184559-Pleurochrysis_carterae.AAC.4
MLHVAWNLPVLRHTQDHCYCPASEDKPLHPRSTEACCTTYIDGEPCRRKLETPALLHNHFHCGAWRNKIGIDANNKLQKMKQAQAGVSIKLSPVVLVRGLRGPARPRVQPAAGRRWAARDSA